MKKKCMKIISGLFAAVLTLAATGCGSQSSVDQQPETDPILNGFEVFDRDIQLLNVFNRFGRLEENTDKKYIKSGEKSLHIQPFGGRIIANTANPFFVMPTTSSRFEELNYSDFSKVDKVSFWIYNAEEENLNIGVGFQIGNIGTPGGRPAVDRVQRTTSEYFVLKSGWNRVVYEVQPAYLELQGLDVAAVNGIAFEFDYVWSNDFTDAPDLYMDDVSLTYLEEEKTSSLEIPIVKTKTADGLDSWTLCDFENAKQAWYLYPRMEVMPPAGQPVLKVVNSAEYGTLQEKGMRALLMSQKHGGGQRGSYIGVFLYSEIVKAAIDAIGEDIKNNPQNYVFRFDAFNAGNVKAGFAVAFVGTATGSNFNVEPKQWQTFTSISFKDLNDRSTTGKNYTDEPGDVRFAWSDYSASGYYKDKPLLIDNFRIDKIV